MNTSASSFVHRARAAFAVPGYQRARAMRRLAAFALCVAALASGLSSLRATDPAIVTFSSDVPAGTVLSDEHLQLTRLPERVVPAQSTAELDLVVGHVTATHGSPGQPVALNQLLGPEFSAAFVGPDAAENSPEMHTMVPVKLAEPDIIPLLHAGDEVNVITSADDDAHPRIIAAGGRVILAGEEGGEATDSVLILLSDADAHAVASASLNHPLTVVLTGDRARPATENTDLK